MVAAAQVVANLVTTKLTVCHHCTEILAINSYIFTTSCSACLGFWNDHQGVGCWVRLGLAGGYFERRHGEGGAGSQCGILISKSECPVESSIMSVMLAFLAFE